MSNGGRIGFDIDFNVNKTPLNQLKASLQDLKRMTAQDMADINFTGLDEANKDLEKMQASVRKVERALDRAFNKDLGTLNLTKFNKELQRMDLNSIYENFNRAGDAGRAAFRNTTSEILTTNMQMKKTSKVLSEIGDTMKNTIKWGVASSVMNSFAGSVQQAFGYIKHLDSSLNDIRIVTGYSADEMDRFAEKANKAAKALAASTTDYTEASLIYYQQGLSGAEVESRAETTLKAANVTGQAAAEVSEQLTAVWNGYKVSAEETEMYVDKLAAVAASTAADLEELSTGMSKVASAAMTSGVNMDQLSATLATVISVTRQAPETVGTAFKTIYARLGDLAVDGVDEFGTSLGSVSKKMATMGIQILDEAGNLREMGTIVEEVAAQWDTWTEAQKQAAAVAMAGKRQYNNLISLFENWDMYESALLTSQTSLGTLSEQQEIYLDSAEASLRQLATSAEGVYDSLLDADTIKSVAGGLSDILSFLEKMIDSIGGGGTVLLGIGAILTRIFSGQIAKGIQNVANNLSTFKGNANQAAAAMESLKTMQSWAKDGANEVDKATKKIIDLKAEILKVSGVLSAEEQNQLDGVIQHISDAQAKLDKYLTDQSKLGSALYRETEKGVHEDDWQAIEEEGKRLFALYDGDTKKILEHNESYKKLAKSIEEAQEEQKKLSSSAKESLRNLHSTANFISDNINEAGGEEIQASQDNFIKLIKNLNEDVEQMRLSDEMRDEINESISFFDKLAYSGVASTEEIEKAFAEMASKIVRALDSSEQSLKDLDAAAREAGIGIRYALEENIQAGFGALDSSLKDIEMTAKLNNIVDALGGVEQVLFGFIAILNGFKAFGDETLSVKEKISQLVLAIVSGVPMIITGVMACTAAMVAFAISIDAAAMKGVSGFAKIGKAAQICGAKIMGVVSLIPGWGKAVIAFVALTAAFAAIAKMAYNAETALDKAKQSTEAARQEFEKTQSVINDINSKLTSWNEAVDTLNNLEKGTAAWRQQLIEANTQVLALLDTYPQLAKYITKDSNGLMSITQEGLDVIAEENAKRLESSATQLYAAQAGQAKIEKNNTILEIGQTTGVSVGMSKVIDYGTKYGTEFLHSSEGVVAVLEELGLSASYAKNILAEVPAIEEAIQKTAAYNTEIEMHSENLLDSVMKQQSSEYSNLSAEEQRLARKQMQNEGWDDTFEANYKNRQNDRDKKIRNDYQKLVNAEDWKENDDGSIEYLIDGVWTAIDDTTARLELATDDTSKAFGDVTSQATATAQALALLKNKLLSDNNSQIGSRKAMSENEAEALATGTKTGGIDLETLSDEEFKNFRIGVSGDVDNNYKFTQTQANAAGFEGEEAVNDYIAWLESEAKEEFNRRKEDREYRVDKVIETSETKYGIEAKQQDFTDAGFTYEDMQNWEAIEAHLDKINIQTLGWAESLKLAKQQYEKIANREDFDSTTDTLATQYSTEYNIDADEYKSLADYLYECGDALDGVGEGIQENAEASQELAKEMLRYDKAVESATEKMDDWMDAFNNGTIEDQSVAMGEMAEAYGNLLDVDGKELSKDFLRNVDNLELMKKAINGNEDAYNQLMDAAQADLEQQQWDLHPGIDTDAFYADKEAFESELEKMDFDDLEIGAKIDDSQAIAAMNRMINSAKFTKDQAEAYLASMGIDAEIVEETATAEDNMAFPIGIPKVTLEPKVIENDGFWKDLLGETINVPKITFDTDVNNVPLPKSFTGFGLRVKSATKSSGGDFKHKNSSSASGNKKKGGGGGGKGSTAKKTYQSSSTKKDRYREVNNSLKELGTELERLANQQDKLYGKDLLNNLNKQLDIIEQQVEKTKEKLAIAKQEAKEMRTQSLKNQDPDVYNDLLDFGIKFDAAGNISNYDKIFDQWDKKVQDLTDKYNKMSAKEQEKDKDKDNGVAAQLEKASQNRDTLENLIKEYDTLIYDTIPGLEDEITEMAYQQIDIKLEGFQIEADLRLDVKEALDNWYDFRKELSEFMDSDDLAGLANIAVSKYSEVAAANIEESLAYTTNTLLKELQAWDADPTKYKGQFAARDTLGNILKDEEGNVLFDEVAFREAIQENSGELREAILSQYELIEEVNDLYLEGIDAVAEGFNEHIESLEFIGDQLQHNLRMTELLKGENAYEDFGKIYENQISNLRVQLDEHQKQALYYEKMMLTETDEEARKKYAELHRESLTAAEEIIEATAELLKDKLLNEVKGFIKEFNESMGLPSVIKTKWELQTEYSEEYLDPIEKAYELESLTNKIQQEIAGNDSVYAQKQLNKFLNDELKLLREKDKLSKYEVERANALYELELKKIALAEAQNNKTQMRLRRDASGNYSYQFVADEEEIAQAQQEVLDAQNNLYQMDKDNYQKQQGVLLDQIQNLGEIQQEIAEASSDEERQSLEIRKKALESFIEDTGKQMNLYREYVGESALDLTKLVNGDVSELDVEDMLPDYISATDELIEKINNGEFAEAFKLLGEQAEAAMSEAAAATQNMFNTSEETTQKAIEYADEWTNSLIANNEALQTQLEFLAQKNEEMQKEKENLAKIVELYNEAIAAEKTLAGISLRDANAIAEERDAPTIDLSNIASYDTGGYTGDWGSSRGRLAILHQKEMVLDERDTANMMKAVSILRDFSFDALEMKNQLVEKTMEIQEPKQKDLASLHADMINENMKAVVKSVEASIQRLASALEPTFNAFNAINQQPSENDIYNIEIHAEFPDATNAKEIEQAFLQLTNIATQRAYTTKR